MQRVVAASIVLLAASGCFQAVLREGPVSTLGFTCAMMDPLQDDVVRVEHWGGSWAQPVGTLVLGALANLTGRPSGTFTQLLQPAVAAPLPGWNVTAAAAWVPGSYLRNRVLTLTILWVPGLDDGNLTSFVAAPGTVVVNEAAVTAAAARLERPAVAVAAAVTLHAVGHALGVVNQGIPVAWSDLQVREGPPGHDPDPTSVLHAGWDDARTAFWVANATYDRFSANVLADWRAARGAGGVCA